jgi:hypothetical protein
MLSMSITGAPLSIVVASLDYCGNSMRSFAETANSVISAALLLHGELGSKQLEIVGIKPFRGGNH